MRRDQYSKGLHCGCGKEICNKSKTGLCHPCFMVKLTSDPERNAKVSASLKRYRADPRNHAALEARARRAGLTRKKCPVWRQNAINRMRNLVQPLAMTPDALAKRNNADTSLRSVESRLSWCPHEYRAEYHFLRSKRLPAPEAKALIMAEIARKERRLSPFERQDLAMAQGAKLIANDTAPSPYAAEVKWSVG